MIEQIIPPEIKHDLFYKYINQLATNPNLKSFLEIGSSSGDGSTEAFVMGIRDRIDRDQVQLHCMEISDNRFQRLKNFYKEDNFVKAHHLSSIALSEFPTKDEIVNFYRRVPSTLNNYDIETVLAWYSEDINYLKKYSLTENGINRIREVSGIKYFDMVLIDGSEFTGERDLYSVMGSKIIALDDVCAFKCWNAYQILLHHSSYQLLTCDLTTRNGFAVFNRNY